MWRMSFKILTFPISLNTSARSEFWTFIQNTQPCTINTTKAHVLETIIIDDVPIFSEMPEILLIEQKSD